MPGSGAVVAQAPPLTLPGLRPRALLRGRLFLLALWDGRVQRGAMAGSPTRRRSGVGVLIGIILIGAAVLMFAPDMLGGWIGGIIGQVWATALAAITALLSGLFGA